MSALRVPWPRQIARGIASGFRAFAAVSFGALLVEAGCNDSDRSEGTSGISQSPACKTQADCLRYYFGDASILWDARIRAEGYTRVCFAGYCELYDPATTKCSDNGDCRFGNVCARSGVRAVCDGCTNDSLCVTAGMCAQIAGHACVASGYDASTRDK